MGLRIPLLVLGAVLSRSFSAGGPVPLWGDLNPGPHAVGFRAIYRYDHSRVFEPGDDLTGQSFKGEQARPIRIFLWYPAKAARKRPMTYGAYTDIVPKDVRFMEWNEALNTFDRWATLNWTDGSAQSAQTLMKSPMTAIREAPPKPGPFPLVFHFTGHNNRRNENTVLWEYLASHGYVVATVPQIAETPIGMEINGKRHADRETQVRDMQYAMAVMREFTSADRTRMGGIGYSFGSIFAMRFAFSNPNVKAVTTLDGNVNHASAHSILEGGFGNPALSAAWLNLHREDYRDLDRTLWEKLTRADRYRYIFSLARHGDFEDFAMGTALLPEQTPAFELEKRDPPTGRKNYETVCRYVRHFMDAYLKMDAAGKRFLAVDPTENGVPKKIISAVERKPGEGWWTVEDLVRIILRHGPEKALDLYREAHKQGLVARIEEKRLVSYGIFLQFGGRELDKAGQVLAFAIEIYPKNARAHRNLARIYEAQGRRQEAAKLLEQANTLDP